MHPVARGHAGAHQARARLYRVTSQVLKEHPDLLDEVFGPAAIVVECESTADYRDIALDLPGQLTASVHGTDAELGDHRDLVEILEGRAGRVLFNGYPTGVEVCHAMVHGGPVPATSDPRTTSVGTAAIERFLRPVCYQDCPQALLPEALRDANPLALRRLVDGDWDAGSIAG